MNRRLPHSPLPTSYAAFFRPIDQQIQAVFDLILSKSNEPLDRQVALDLSIDVVNDLNGIIEYIRGQISEMFETVAHHTIMVSRNRAWHNQLRRTVEAQGRGIRQRHSRDHTIRTYSDLFYPIKELYDSMISRLDDLDEDQTMDLEHVMQEAYYVGFYVEEMVHTATYIGWDAAGGERAYNDYVAALRLDDGSPPGTVQDIYQGQTDAFAGPSSF